MAHLLEKLIVPGFTAYEYDTEFNLNVPKQLAKDLPVPSMT